MRRRERVQELEQRSVARGARSPTIPSLAINEIDQKMKGSSGAAKVGAEAFVARGGGSDGYGQPEWETDETLEAYIGRS